MRRLLSIMLLCLAAVVPFSAHNFGASITWNREISRLMYASCGSCHRPGGSAFSLMTYTEVQPRAVAVKEAVLARRMPPWGAVKGFGSFRNDQGLMQEQIELITKWVDSGTPRGNNPRALPKEPAFEAPQPIDVPAAAVRVTGEQTLRQAMLVDGVLPENVPSDRSAQIVAQLPGGRVEPLVWLYEYSDHFAHPFLFRRPLQLPAGASIHGVPPGASLILIPAAR
jgi:hypothetical protein